MALVCMSRLLILFLSLTLDRLPYSYCSPFIRVPVAI